MFGHKLIPSREGGIVLIVEELTTRMVKLGHSVTYNNLRGKQVMDRRRATDHSIKYKGIRIDTVSIITDLFYDASTKAILNLLEEDLKEIENRLTGIDEKDGYKEVFA